MSNKPILTQERLKEVLHYDCETGEFTKQPRIGSRGRQVGGFKVGCLTSKTGNGKGKRYIQIGIDSGRYLAHRLAWLYVYGCMPENEIDHIDGNGLNNAISNLRDVNRTENVQNRNCCSINNKTGFLGVFLHKQTGKYRTRIMVDRKMIELGLFKTPEEAGFAYIEAKRKYHSTCTI